MLIRPVDAAEPVDPPPAPEIETIPLATIYSAQLDLSAVDLVIAPLIGLGFDSVDLIESLTRSGFRGHLRVTARWLPDGDIVLAELRALAEPAGISVTLHTGPRASWSVARGAVSLRS